METYTLHHDIPLLCIRASSFPEGVLAAHKRLFALLEGRGDRVFYGLSWPENGRIIYKAAAESLLANEAEILDCEPFLLTKGVYFSKMVLNFRQDEMAIGRTFEALLTNPDIDPNGCCVEMYLGAHDVLCLVKRRPEP